MVNLAITLTLPAVFGSALAFGCGAAAFATPVRGNAVADRLVAAKVSDVKVKGRVAEIQDRFFANRVLGDYAKTEIWKEAHAAFAHPDDDVFNHGIGLWKGEFWGKLRNLGDRP